MLGVPAFATNLAFLATGDWGDETSSSVVGWGEQREPQH